MALTGIVGMDGDTQPMTVGTRAPGSVHATGMVVGSSKSPLSQAAQGSSGGDDMAVGIPPTYLQDSMISVNARKATAYTLEFGVVNSLLRPNRKSGAGFATGDVQISIDGGAFVNTTNLPVELGTTGRYSLALVAAEMNGNQILIKIQDLSSPAQFDPMEVVISTEGIVSGAVVANGSNTSSTFATSGLGSTSSVWTDGYVRFTTGALAGQVKKITGYNGGTSFITTNAFTTAPSAGDLFVIVNG